MNPFSICWQKPEITKPVPLQPTKKIIIIGSAHPLRGGGIATFNERLAREFQRTGHTVSIFSFSLQYPGFLFPGTSQYTNDPAPAGLNINSRINSINPFNWLQVGREIRELKPDVVVVRYWLPFMAPCLGTILRIIRKNKHTRIVCIADNIIPHEPKPWDRFLTRYFVQPVDKFIVMSDQVMKDLKHFIKHQPTRLVPHPLYDNFGERISREAARAKLNIPENQKVLLFFGFIRKYKGLDILLEAMKLLQTNFPKHLLPVPQLLIAGEFYDNADTYNEQVTALGIRDLVLMHTHFIADNEVKNYLCAADVVIQPYRTATQSGVTPLAYHFEIPMIVTNVGGLPALVPDGRVGLVAAPTAQSIAEKIIDYFEKGEQHFLPHLLEEKKKYQWINMVHACLEPD